MKTNMTHLRMAGRLLAVAVVACGACMAWAQSTTTFTKITTGEIVNEAGIAWGAAWGDFDNDGFIDLVVGNEGADFLYRNNRDGTFTNITSSPVVTNDFDGGSSVAFADYDNDGHLDLIVGGYRGPRNKLIRFTGVPGRSYAIKSALRHRPMDNTRHAYRADQRPHRIHRHQHGNRLRVLPNERAMNRAGVKYRLVMP